MEETEIIREELSTTREPEKQFDLMFKLSDIYWRTDQKKMLEILKEVIELARATDNQPRLLQGLWHTGSCYRALLKENLALKHFNEALALSIELGIPDKQARILNSLGALYQNTSKFSDAIDYFEQSRAIASECGDKGIEAIAVYNIGVCFHNLGDYSEAMRYYLEASGLFEKLQGSPSSGVVKAMGSLAMEIGDTATAIKYFLRALKILEAQENYREKAPLLTDMGTAYSSRQEYGLALQNYEEAVRLTELAGDLYQTVILYCMMANLYFETKSFKKGWEFLQKAEQHLLESHSAFLESMIFHFKAVGYRAEGNYSAAGTAIGQSLAISREIGNTKLICAALTLKGLTLEDQAQYESAAEILQEAVATAETNNYKGEEYYRASEVRSIVPRL